MKPPLSTVAKRMGGVNEGGLLQYDSALRIFEKEGCLPPEGPRWREGRLEKPTELDEGWECALRTPGTSVRGGRGVKASAVGWR